MGWKEYHGYCLALFLGWEDVTLPNSMILETLGGHSPGMGCHSIPGGLFRIDADQSIVSSLKRGKSKLDPLTVIAFDIIYDIDRDGIPCGEPKVSRVWRLCRAVQIAGRKS